MRPRLNDLIGPNGETREWLILASIRAGAYPHVAAQAYGISAERLLRWLARARVRQAPRKIRRLVARVHQAAARARLKAEMGVHESDPRFWLRHGPGKETRHAPGWSALAKPVFETADRDEGEVLASPEFQAVVAEALSALERFPDAHAAVAQVMQRQASP